MMALCRMAKQRRFNICQSSSFGEYDLHIWVAHGFIVDRSTPESFGRPVGAPQSCHPDAVQDPLPHGVADLALLQHLWQLWNLREGADQVANRAGFFAILP